MDLGESGTTRTRSGLFTNILGTSNGNSTMRLVLTIMVIRSDSPKTLNFTPGALSSFWAKSRVGQARAIPRQKRASPARRREAKTVDILVFLAKIIGLARCVLIYLRSAL